MGRIPDPEHRLLVDRKLLAFHFELLGNGEKAVEIVLRHVHLAMVHEVEHTFQIRVLHPLQIDQRVLVRIPPQHRSTQKTS
jgi:hypothetical protein